MSYDGLPSRGLYSLGLSGRAGAGGGWVEEDGFFGENFATSGGREKEKERVDPDFFPTRTLVEEKEWKCNEGNP